MRNPTPTGTPQATIYVPPDWQADPARSGPLAILAGRHLAFYRPDDPRIPQALAMASERHVINDDTTLPDVVRLLMIANAQTCLILPNQVTGANLPFVDAWPDSAHAALARLNGVGYSGHILTGHDFGPFAAGIVLRHPSRSAPLTLYMAGSDQWGLTSQLKAYGVRDLDCIRAVANSWLLAQWALGVRLRFSPSYVGQLLLRISLRRAVDRNPARFAPMDEEWLELCYAHPARYVHWYSHDNAARAMSQTGSDSLHIWSYDRNWSFVSSARRVPIGNPTPVSAFVSGFPGLYRLSAEAPAPETGRLMPGFFSVEAEPGAVYASYPHVVRDVWAWEPQIRAALVAGWRIEIHQGYSWRDSHDLRPWQDAMWHARSQIRAAGARASLPAQCAAVAQAEAIVKRAGVAAIGRLKQRTGHVVSIGDPARWDIPGVTVSPGEREVAMTATDLMRPEMWSTIIAGAGERLIHQLRSYSGLGIAGYIDAAYFAAPMPEIAAKPTSAGGWHLETGGLLVPGEALKSGLSGFVNTVARGRREARIAYAN